MNPVPCGLPSHLSGRRQEYFGKILHILLKKNSTKNRQTKFKTTYIDFSPTTLPLIHQSLQYKFLLIIYKLPTMIRCSCEFIGSDTCFYATINSLPPGSFNLLISRNLIFIRLGVGWFIGWLPISLLCWWNQNMEPNRKSLETLYLNTLWEGNVSLARYFLQ